MIDILPISAWTYVCHRTWTWRCADIVVREKEYSQKLQREGKWRHLWRIVGEYAKFSILDVADHDELHVLLSGLPLFP